MTVFESWELDAVILTINAPECIFMLEIVIVWLIGSSSEFVLVDTWPEFLMGIV